MWIHLPVLSAFVYLLLILYVVTQENSKGNRLLLFLLITSFFWPALYYVEMVIDSMAAMIFIHRVRIAAIPLVPLSLFMLLLHLVGKERSVPRWGWGLLWFLPAGLAAFVLTTESHRWFLYDFGISERYGMNFLTASPGPVFWFYVSYNYVVSCLNFIMLLTWCRNASYWGRRQAVLLLIAGMGPLLLDLGRMIGIEPIPGFALAPATLGLSGSLIVWAVVGYRLAQASPVARAVLLDRLPSIVVVLDEMNRIVDVNRRTCETIGRSRQQLSRVLPESLDAPWRNWLRPEWVPNPEEGQQWKTELDGQIHYFERSVHPLCHRQRLIGHLIYLDDVTEYRQANLAMAEHERLQEQAALLKDLHDGVGGIAAHIGLLAQLALVEESDEARSVTLKGIMGLAQEMGVEVRRFISVLEQPDYGWNDWMLEIRTFCRTALDGLPIRLHFQIGADQAELPMRSDIGLSVYRLIKECVTNVVKHANANDVWVTVELQGEHLLVEVRDNGRGLAEQPKRQGGLLHMQERVRRMGGTLETISNGGVAQRVRIPVDRLWRQTTPGSMSAGDGE